MMKDWSGAKVEKGMSERVEEAEKKRMREIKVRMRKKRRQSMR